MTLLIILLLPILLKTLWVFYKTYKHGNIIREKSEIIKRAKYLVSKISTSPQQLLNEMPSQIPEQFQGEWAIYSCSMTCKALANIASLFPDYKEKCRQYMSKIIDIAMSKEIRKYDTERFNEDAIDGIEGNQSHLSYYSHIAWMIGEYKLLYKDDKYDSIYHSLCKAMNRRIQNSPTLNIPTYPHENIYIPDMLVAIVSLNIYNRIYHGEYQDTVNAWIRRAKTEWIDPDTGLLVSFLSDYGISPMIKGSYSSLNCYYLSLIDIDFARKQYQCLKKHFKQAFPLAGIKEYHNDKSLFGFDIDAGPIVFRLSASGIAFTIGCASMLNDSKFRKQLLRTAEIVGTTITINGKSRYLVGNFVLVGEAIVLAMRTSFYANYNS